MSRRAVEQPAVGREGSATNAASIDPEAPARRGRGRPRRSIDREQVADVVEELFEEGGYDAVSIEEIAKRLGVSRATLYRTVPSKEHLLAILFERMTTELYDAALAIVENPDLTHADVDPAGAVQPLRRCVERRAQGFPGRAAPGLRRARPSPVG